MKGQRAEIGGGLLQGQGHRRGRDGRGPRAGAAFRRPPEPTTPFPMCHRAGAHDGAAWRNSRAKSTGRVRHEGAIQAGREGSRAAQGGAGAPDVSKPAD